MSYNIHYGIGMDGKTDLARIANVISMQNIDIVGLQEIGDSAMAAKFGKPTQIQFLNTHFDWLRSIGSQEARLATVDVIERGFMNDSKLPTILTGGF